MRSGFVKIVLLYATFASLWIFTSDYVAARLLGDAEQLAIVGVLKGMLFVGITSLFLFVLLQRFAAGQAAPAPATDDDRGIGRRWLILLFAVLAVSVAAVGRFSYRMLADAMEQEQGAKLAAVAQLKARQVEDWLDERRADVREATQGSLFSEALLQWLANGDAATRSRLLARLERTLRIHGYAAIEFFDPGGRRLLSIGEAQPPLADVPAMVARAGAAGEPMLLDLKRTEAGNVRLAYAGFVYGDAAKGGTASVVAVFTIDPAHHLFPLIESWPYPIATAESALARRDGDHVMFLSALRYGDRGAMEARIPLSRQELPAAQAAIHGPGLYRGVDYRGIRVFTAAREVSGTAWLVLAKIDETEVFKDIRRLAIVSLALTLMAIGGVGLLLALVWRQQRWREALAREEAVRQSEARFRFLFENMLEAFAYCRMIFGEDGEPQDIVYLGVNPAFGRITGLKDVVGRRVGEFVPGIREAAPDLFATYGRVARGGPPEHFETHLAPLRRWYAVSAYAAEPGCFVAVFDDITERKEAQAQLENERSRLRTLVHTIPDLVWLKDPNGVFLLCNPEFERFLGMSEAEIVGKTDYDFVPKELADFFREKDRAAVAAGTPSVNEEWVQYTGDGHRALLETLKTPMYDGAGRLIGVLGIGRDVTARRGAEEQLRKLWLAVEQSPNGVIITDTQAHIEYVNEACVRDTGYAREELVGQNPRMLGSGQTPRATYQALWSALSAGRQWQGEFINRRKNGEIYINFVRASPVRQPDGQVSHYLAIQEDVTERKRMGQELDQHRFHLEELVVERTAQLAAAREAAEVANRAKGAFVANISHEIRTPLNAILGFTHLLQRHCSDAEQADKLARIGDAGRHLLALINDILDFSKIEAGKVTLEPRDFALAELLENVCALVRDKAQAKGLALVVDIDPALPNVLRGDATRLSQALLNYVSNAVKFSERGNVAVHARLLDDAGDLLQVHFTVKDEGIGIAREAQARLFADFEQADQSTTRRYGGTGLGLAITRRLAELMGGDVGVVSEPGAGSTFSLTVRLARGAAAASQSAAIAAVAPDAEATLRREHRGCRLLLAEDNRINREVATELLQEAGCRIDVAEDGAQAVDMARRQAYDLILMDIHMPVMDGLAAARAIRALPGGASVPIIALTASAFSEDRRDSLDAGMVDHLAKPVDPDRLFATVLRWLPKGTGRAAGTDISAAETAQPPAAATATAMPAIAGLDMAAGLVTARGRPATYARLLRLYADTHANDAKALRQRLGSGDRDGAVLLAHSLKGASGMMGATQVQALASELEKALRDQRAAEAIEELVNALEAQLDPLVAALLAAFPAAAAVDA